MMFRSAIAAMVVLAVTTGLAQGTPPASTTSRMGPRPSAVRRGVPVTAQANTKPNESQTPDSLHQRLQDLQTTVSQMHALLKKMHAKTDAGGSKDSFAKANLDMWDLMVVHLDKQLEQLRVASAARDDIEARRAAMYKQAEAKAEAAARAARRSQKPAESSGQGTSAPSATAPSAEHAAPSSPAPASPSPN